MTNPNPYPDPDPDPDPNPHRDPEPDPKPNPTNYARGRNPNSYPERTPTSMLAIRPGGALRVSNKDLSRGVRLGVQLGVQLGFSCETLHAGSGVQVGPLWQVCEPWRAGVKVELTEISGAVGGSNTAIRDAIESGGHRAIKFTDSNRERTWHRRSTHAEGVGNLPGV